MPDKASMSTTQPGPRPRTFKFLVPLAIFVAIGIFLGIGLTLDPREVPSPLIGKPAPEFSLPPVQGRTLSYEASGALPPRSVPAPDQAASADSSPARMRRSISTS